MSKNDKIKTAPEGGELHGAFSNMGNLACPLNSSHTAMAAIEAKKIAREKGQLPLSLFMIPFCIS